MGAARDRCADTVDGVSGTIAEAWGQGYMVGGLVVLMLLTLASLRRHALLHKLILSELILATFRGTYIFFSGSDAGWYSSSTSVLLYISYNLHNVINWIKIKPFLGRTGNWIYLGTLILVWPYWIVECYFLFQYNNNLGSDYFIYLRPWEFLCREPWWLFTTGYLIYIIKRAYDCSIIHLIRTSGKFLVLLLSMALSIGFVIADVVIVLVIDTPCRGKNPLWKIAFIFKCTADVIFLDDFKSVLDRISVRGSTSSELDSLDIKEDRDNLRHIETISPRNPGSQRPGKASRDWLDSIQPV
ncbi:hypothetical protein P171DRAFT_349019 [Karstenula rhodostoma CBS 690.94]|uniref:Uncharacterized protein n=1 Tax=Karstenula rhodostoma CBS 690.94 TaxID=1392251 RepID=A0A9P4UH09_9PLEO|nr:hypothetical protein P171DRAFT_349019 [Karstenula rhodostoma CBS 690.94]